MPSMGGKAAVMGARKSLVTRMIGMVLAVIAVACILIAVIGVTSSRSMINDMTEEELHVATTQLASQATNEYDGDWAFQNADLYKGGENVQAELTEEMDALKADTHIEYSLMAGGNFAIDIDPAAVARSDEIGELNRSMELIAEKLSAAIRTIAELSARVRQAGDDMSGSAVKANQAMQQVSHAVEEIAHGAQDQAESVQKSAGVKDIEESTSAIKAVADQTNLLSLNASIEAARAGEAGRGFAVVATEIQKLATQSQDAVAHINEIVARLAQSSAESAESMDALRTAFAAQNEGIGGVRENLASMTKGADAVAEAATKTAGLSQGMDDAKNRLTNEIEGLSAISEENAASTEETSASMNELATSFQTIETAADELKTLAAQLDDELKFFKVKKA